MVSMKSRVAVVRVKGTVEEAVGEAVGLVGGLNVSKGERVLIKPNLCYTRNPHNMVMTDFRLLRAVIGMVRELTDKVLVVESDNISGSAEKRALESGLLELLKEVDVEFMNLSTDEVEVHEVAGFRLEIPKTVLEADRIVNLPKMKTSGPTLVTLSLKNLFGLLANRDKKRMHKALDEILPYLGKVVRQDMIIVDGIVAMEGNGPSLQGSPRQVGVLLAGQDAVAMDAVVCQIIGLDPDRLPLFRAAARRGWWPAEITVAGTPVADVAIPDFCLPDTPQVATGRTGRTWLSRFATHVLTPRLVPQRERCTACRTCVRICPQQAITIVDRLAVVDDARCIRCYCCQEVCPEAAIDLEFSRLGRLVRWSGVLGRLE